MKEPTIEEIKELVFFERDDNGKLQVGIVITDYEMYKQKESKIFNFWWKNVGSGITSIKEHDTEEHTKRVAYVAWLDRGLLIKNGDEHEN